jgi:HAD superfamily hydrolase (TIGR01662 family)
VNRPTLTVVVPTLGRPSLGHLLDALLAATSPDWPILLVDDRRRRQGSLGPIPPALRPRLGVLRAGGAGPAAARNLGWRAARTPWVAFLDDDVVPAPDWGLRLAADLEDLGPEMAGSQGRIVVPLPEGRRPTDWERDVAGLQSACWATADLAYRREALEEVGGFDERFPRAYREDTDLGLRLQRAGYLIVRGERATYHPVPPSRPLASLSRQRGNADDIAMWALHGPDWRVRGAAPPGRAPRHLAITASLAGGVLAAMTGRSRLAAVAGASWLAGTAELAWARIAPGPRTSGEIIKMTLTSLALAPLATWWRAVGLARLPYLLTRPGPVSRPAPRCLPAAVLFDRDGTLVEDVPYNGDPGLVRLRPGATEAVDRLRSAGIRLGVVSNQSGVADGRLSLGQVTAVNHRIEELLGPFQTWAICAHSPSDGCGCRKPAPGLVLRAAAALDITPGDCVVVGDIATDIKAALAAGATAVMVPSPATRRSEVAAARRRARVAPDLRKAVDLIMETSP